eukprot:gnl/TRDRNA2_/TRDRNA2_30161_c0_seq1.p1 gnl/TRDRNA2_/TRDRNA2_30161_c0~~gnl/TRDRNA2_/TRDRNA2_30161_c0_seq1.p1  ORF type:complete len:431 (+),score=61.99 gnl/TRDRNA2_/TRDRNA2_30161_c0_seq1:97-1389(+)
MSDPSMLGEKMSVESMLEQVGKAACTPVLSFIVQALDSRVMSAENAERQTTVQQMQIKATQKALRDIAFSGRAFANPKELLGVLDQQLRASSCGSFDLYGGTLPSSLLRCALLDASMRNALGVVAAAKAEVTENESVVVLAVFSELMNLKSPSTAVEREPFLQSSFESATADERRVLANMWETRWRVLQILLSTWTKYFGKKLPSSPFDATAFQVESRRENAAPAVVALSDGPESETKRGGAIVEWTFCSGAEHLRVQVVMRQGDGEVILHGPWRRSPHSVRADKDALLEADDNEGESGVRSAQLHLFKKWADKVKKPDSQDGIYGRASTSHPPVLPMVVDRDYEAEAEGYLSLKAGDELHALLESPEQGDTGCAWPMYVFAYRSGMHGWVPLDILWQRYIDFNSGCKWLFHGPTSSCCWEEPGAEVQMQ